MGTDLPPEELKDVLAAIRRKEVVLIGSTNPSGSLDDVAKEIEEAIVAKEREKQ
ncbi:MULTISPECIES: hypothetical protein [unclassified Mesorhizobium]|uniref:hypothetical protein n=1 Tax=unclassified Mesorhizobium TaxID=325217 RepID=UPI001677E469|nr:MULTISPECIES: hypothetical protein [unclassified Mesorhizobium]